MLHNLMQNQQISTPPAACQVVCPELMLLLLRCFGFVQVTMLVYSCPVSTNVIVGISFVWR